MARIGNWNFSLPKKIDLRKTTFLLRWQFIAGEAYAVGESDRIWSAGSWQIVAVLACTSFRRRGAHAQQSCALQSACNALDDECIRNPGTASTFETWAQPKIKRPSPCICLFYWCTLRHYTNSNSTGDGVGELAVYWSQKNHTISSHPNPQNDWPHNTTAKLS
jgi:hypothetical protein